MAGAVVTDPLLCEAPNDANVCPALTDLEGVYANNTDTDCNIFATCAFNSPLGISLNLTASQSVEVADAQLCELSVPGVEVCTSGPMAGAVVTDPLLCEAPNDANVCPALTDLEGVYANNTDTDCNIFATCAFNSPLGISLNLTASQSVEVADAQLCELSVPEVELCPDDTDLEGVFVNDTDTDCELSISANPEAQCLKCADLAALQASQLKSPPPPTPIGQNAQLQASVDLIGDNAADASVFSICDNITTASSEFNTTITIPPAANNQETKRIELKMPLHYVSITCKHKHYKHKHCH